LITLALKLEIGYKENEIKKSAKCRRFSSRNGRTHTDITGCKIVGLRQPIKVETSNINISTNYCGMVSYIKKKQIFDESRDPKAANDGTNCSQITL
jgi:hypothetical protein